MPRNSGQQGHIEQGKNYPFLKSASALLLTPAVQSASPGKANQCFACHGVNGVSVNPDFPSLAGQSKVYIIKQLKAFKSGERKSPIMATMESGLDDEDISAVADYFSNKKAGGGEEIAKGYEGAPS
ncbi:MAG: cytochrome c, partial [Gammaproteobacteria bacterium]|nr:cytochrome c [Gammaproteobacteria bacterium]